MTPSEFGQHLFEFGNQPIGGLLVCAGGFEERSLTFLKRLRRPQAAFDDCVVLRYESQQGDNEANYHHLRAQLSRLGMSNPHVVPITSDNAVLSATQIRECIRAVTSALQRRCAYVDVSAMTHLWATVAIHASLSCALATNVIYTEAERYSPSENEMPDVVSAWAERRYEDAARFLQSKGLKEAHILPEFGGNFRPGRAACLVVFVGYEPNRIEGLVDAYAPGALIVLYGVSPHGRLKWRTDLSKDLHRDLFLRWKTREAEVSTLLVDEVRTRLEEEFDVIRAQYDVAITPQCSKMQALAAYLFWRDHPEVQLLFTSPVHFSPERYSHGAGETWVYAIPPRPSA